MFNIENSHKLCSVLNNYDKITRNLANLRTVSAGISCKSIDGTRRTVVAFHEGSGKGWRLQKATGWSWCGLLSRGWRCVICWIMAGTRSGRSDHTPSRVHPSGITMLNQIDAPLSCVRATAACFNYPKSDRRHVARHACLFITRT